MSWAQPRRGCFTSPSAFEWAGAAPWTMGPWGWESQWGLGLGFLVDLATGKSARLEEGNVGVFSPYNRRFARASAVKAALCCVYPWVPACITVTRRGRVRVFSGSIPFIVYIHFAFASCQ